MVTDISPAADVLPAKPDLAHVRAENGIIKESVGYRTFRVVNAIVLILICIVTL